ncbi:DUF5134 domain-containing protein [Mycobacterium shigaense]|uniref:Uncharacterized protein n=1 Tax=Mycobacterium shigaense TaxID=722731 RepID=A0A1Z4EEH1_9MYCO|nr:DUF5134 domain-containing protein [Mycobacterium shigaense]MEA1121938.1 DUF5134 domain-containing protein [Mycobacterium shigaense]PRI16166.1 hypothetical protein B2J96_04915 [Mycobacterium shigaense]BAX91371.1 hypothetical protein MSG_01212 [Mycobacterium shigaense]
MIGDLTLRWIVTALFGVGIAAYVYVLVAQRSQRTGTLSHLFHLTMAAAMILMAWHIGVQLSAVGPMIFFALAGASFAYAAGRAASAFGERLTNSYYAVMAAAMVWMYAEMSGEMPRPASHPAPDAMAMDMPGMELTGHEMSRAPTGLGWIAAVNWIAALGFAVVALYWSCRWIARRPGTRMEPLYQACTAAGTAAMFFALL